MRVCRGPMLNSGGRLERQDKYIDILIKDEAEKAAELAKIDLS
ncbi:MAG: hypothetical protein ACLR23_08580 [Clostridia bacterium]